MPATMTPWRILLPLCAGLHTPTASMKRESVHQTRTGRIGMRSTWCERARARSCRHEQ